MGADSGISEELEEDSRSSSIEKPESESGDSSANINQDIDGKRERERKKERKRRNGASDSALYLIQFFVRYYCHHYQM